MADYTNLPDFDSLPAVKDMPQGCAWGVFDKDGKKDHLGCINLLTPSVVKEAYKEAREGISVSLNWPIGAINTPGFLRKGLVHKVISFKEGPFDLHGFDDEVEFNTQCSSQWDSLVHFHHQPTGTGYNGCKPTVAQLEQTFGNEDTKDELPTLQHWHARGGMVGRGVLLDYRAYAEAKGIKYDCFSDHAITVKDLEAVAEHQGTKFKHGDVLIVRSGFTEDLEAPAKLQEESLGSHKCVGVEGSVATARWVWNHHFSAVAGDAIAFEQLPPKREDGSVGTINELGESTAISPQLHYSTCQNRAN
jgi:Putative cyclase